MMIDIVVKIMIVLVLKVYDNNVMIDLSCYMVYLLIEYMVLSDWIVDSVVMVVDGMMVY